MSTSTMQEIPADVTAADLAEWDRQGEIFRARGLVPEGIDPASFRDSWRSTCWLTIQLDAAGLDQETVLGWCRNFGIVRGQAAANGNPDPWGVARLCVTIATGKPDPRTAREKFGAP